MKKVDCLEQSTFSAFICHLQINFLFCYSYVTQNLNISLKYLYIKNIQSCLIFKGKNVKKIRLPSILRGCLKIIVKRRVVDFLLRRTL